MAARWISPAGLEVHLRQGRKSSTDQIIEIRMGSFIHTPTLAEIGVILGLKGANEEREYPQDLGFKGWKKPVDFIRELVRHIAEAPDRDLEHIIYVMERKHQIIRFNFDDNKTTRVQTPTGQRPLF